MRHLGWLWTAARHWGCLSSLDVHRYSFPGKIHVLAGQIYLNFGLTNIVFIVAYTIFIGAAEGLFQNETKETLNNKHKDHNRIWKLGNNSEKYIELLSNNYNEPLNNVCNAKIKEITEIGN